MSFKNWHFSTARHKENEGNINITKGAFNKVDSARFRLQSTTIRYNFSYDGHLHFRWLRNYGGRITSKFFWSKFAWKKWKGRK